MPAIVQWILAAVTLVTFLAAAAVFLRGSADKGTITSLQNSVNALKIESEIKDGQLAEHAAKITGLERQHETDDLRIQALERIVTSADEIARLQAEIENHHSVVTSSLAGLAGLLRDVAQKVGVTNA